jgi:hypothetical protein
VLSRGDYHWQHEPCWYAVREKGKGHWAGDRKQTTLWQIPSRDQDAETVHGTQKPVECMRRPILNNSSPGQAVYEPFWARAPRSSRPRPRAGLPRDRARPGLCRRRGAALAGLHRAAHALGLRPAVALALGRQQAAGTDGPLHGRARHHPRGPQQGAGDVRGARTMRQGARPASHRDYQGGYRSARYGPAALSGARLRRARIVSHGLTRSHAPAALGLFPPRRPVQPWGGEGGGLGPDRFREGAVARFRDDQRGRVNHLLRLFFSQGIALMSTRMSSSTAGQDMAAADS